MSSDVISPDVLDWLGLATLGFVLVPAMLMWLIAYLVIRIAVKHGILAADRARARDRWVGTARDHERL